MEQIKTRIVKADLTELKNAKTGEVTIMTKISYIYPRENTENSLGSDIILASYRPGNILSKIKSFVDSDNKCILELDEQLDLKTNKFKKVIKKINNIEV